MAKTDEPGFFEQHVEKGVLAAAVLILIVTLSMWVVSSRREIAVGNTQASPSEADPALLKQTEQLERQFVNIDVKEPPVPDYLGKMRDSILKQNLELTLRDYVQWTEGQPRLEPASEVDLERPTVALADLELVAPEQPISEVFREVATVPEKPAEAQPQTGRMSFKEVLASHSVAVFDHGDQLKRWAKALAKTPIRPQLIVLAVEAERRHRLPDGTWSAPQPVSPPRFGNEPVLPALPDFTGENLAEVVQALQQLQTASVQQEILEPSYADIVWPNFQIGTWQIHKPRTRVSDVLAEGLVAPGQELRPGLPSRGSLPIPRSYTEEMPLPRPDDGRMRELPRPVSPPDERGRGIIPPPDAGSSISRRDLSGRRDLAERNERPRYSGERVGLPRSYGPQPGVRPGVTSPVRPGITPPVKPAPTPPKPPTPVLVPSLTDQLSSAQGILELWFHDTGLQEGMTYSYRVRLVVVNPLFGHPRDVKDEADAKKLKLALNWSKWSEPVTAKRPTEFFLTGAFRGGQEVYAEIFTKKGVQTVKKQFSLRRGEPIGAPVKMDVMNLTGQIENVEVDFTTGAVAVDFDFDKKIPNPKTGMSQTTIEVLYLDENGQLRCKTMADDKDSKRLDELRNEVEQAPMAAAAGG